jgi:isoleucyl-tRNA synthetase
VTGALEVERREKRIGASLEAAPVVHVSTAAYREALDAEAPGSVDDFLAEIAITSAAHLVEGPVPAGAWRLDDVADAGVEVKPAEGRKCARSWKISPDVGRDPRYPDLSPRDAEAVAEWDSAKERV